MFKVGDKVLCLEGWGDMFKTGKEYTVGDHSKYAGEPDPRTYVYVLCGAGILRGMLQRRFELVQAAPTSRATDPATSKGKRKVNKYEQAVLSCLASGPKTGKEMVAICGFPLNCITPRFAPLRRKGLIAPLYSEGYGHPIVKRDKQIVWVLA